MVCVPVLVVGFGLSYSSFTYALDSSPPATISLDAVREMLATTEKDGRVFPSSDLLTAAEPLIKYSVNVTNTVSAYYNLKNILLSSARARGHGHERWEQLPESAPPPHPDVCVFNK